MTMRRRWRSLPERESTQQASLQTVRAFLPKVEGRHLLWIDAGFATVLLIAVVGCLTWLSVRIGGEAVISREAEG